MYCNKCGTENENSSNFCHKCGAPLKSDACDSDNINKHAGKKLTFSNKKLLAAVLIIPVAALLIIMKNISENKSDSTALTSPHFNSTTISKTSNNTNQIQNTSNAAISATSNATSQSTSDNTANNSANSASESSSENSATAEAQIKKALSGSDTYVFEIQNDFNFDKVSTVGGTTINSDSGSASSSISSDNAQQLLVHFIKGSIIRVNSNSVTMDNNDYQCNLSILDNNGGIKIEITRGNTKNVTQGYMDGVIKGNTITASANINTNTVVDNVGRGIGSAGNFTVSIKKISESELPPKPVENVKIQRNSDKSILVSWEDPNSSDSIESYDIYRNTGSFNNVSKVATVQNCSSWTDTSDEAKSDDFNSSIMLCYYIVANSKNGEKSADSNGATLDYSQLN